LNIKLGLIGGVIGAVIVGRGGRGRSWEGKMSIIIRIPIGTGICWRVIGDESGRIGRVRMMLMGSVIRIYRLKGV